MLATRNAHKGREFAALLAPHEIVALPDDVELPPETGDTFADNALPKARAAAAATGRPAIADDSGIEAAALDGATRRALRALRRRGRHRRGEPRPAAPRGARRQRARVRVRAGVRRPRRARSGSSRAAAPGRLAAAPRGSGGFGYDPVFVPDDGDGRTMAELTDAEKDAISHRGRAARELARWLARDREVAT